MKRSPLARRTRLSPGSCGLARGSGPKRGKGIAKVSEKRKRALVAYRKTVAQLMRRADGNCEWCGAREKLDPHYVERRSRRPGWEGLHALANLVAICRACHDREHFGGGR